MNLDLLRTLLFLPEAGTSFAERIDRLHFFVISLTMLGSAAVFLVTLGFILRYRRVSEPGLTPHVQASRKLEFSFAGSLLGLFVLWWLLGFQQYLDYAAPPTGAQDVYVTAKQWMWKFSYPNGRAALGALVVPVGRDIRLLMTSRDVIHSFYVPVFRVKRDVLPGRYVTAWFKARRSGVYDIFCAEYCGTSHSRMGASVVVLSSRDYEAWLRGGEPNLLAEARARAAQQGAAPPRFLQAPVSMADQGQRAAATNGCFACHTVDGQPHIGPSWRRLYGSFVDLEGGRRVIADEAYLTRAMMDPLTEVVRGYKPTMPTYLGTLRQPEAAAIVEFIKSLADAGGEPRVTLPKVQVSEQSTNSSNQAGGPR